MGTLDDAIREHLELKRQKGAPEDELEQKEAEAFGGRRPAAQASEEATPDGGAEAAAREPRSVEPVADEDLLEPDEVLPEESLEPNGTRPPPVDEAEELSAWEDQPEHEPASAEDLLEETPDFLEETPEHDRLWFEQKPPKDFDLD